MNIKQGIVSLIAGTFSKELSTLFIALLPVFELRLAIPLGIFYFQISWQKAMIFSLIGNMAVIWPLLLFFKYFFKALEKAPLCGGLFRWWFRSVERKSAIVRRWGFWGLVLFVAIPLPGTGAWSGSFAATLIEMPIKKALLAIAIGVLVAGIIITVLSLTVPEFFSAVLNFTV